ncbi:MAG: hypothetical protein PXY39_12805, partial [archaeon]|nr:hypothetical protein [archaeon]
MTYSEKKTSELKELFLKDEKVEVWYKDLEEGSKSTAENYFLWLSKYCQDRELNPLELAKEAKKDIGKAQDKLQKYIQSLKDSAPKSRGLALSAVKSWLVANDIIIQRHIKIKNIRTTPTIVDEKVPTSQELETILDYADIRTKSAISLIAFAGIRPNALSKLTIGDLIDFKINPETKKVEVLKNPARINVRPEISKNKKAYFTFLSTQGCKYVKEYLEMRMRPHKDLMTRVILNGEEISKNAPVIKASAGRPRDKEGLYLTRKA